MIPCVAGWDVRIAVDHRPHLGELAVPVGTDRVEVRRVEDDAEHAVGRPLEAQGRECVVGAHEGDTIQGPETAPLERAYDPLAVQSRDQVDDPVRGRVRRPDRDRLGLEVTRPHVLLFRPRGHLEVLFREEQPLAGRVVLPQRVSDEGVVAQDAAQVGMTRKLEAEEVERLALEPVRGRPDVGHRRKDRLGRVG